MGQILLWVSLVELLIGLPAVAFMLNGGDRDPGDFAFDPLGFLSGATTSQKRNAQEKELANSRLAMLSFGAIATQAALGPESFPYVALPW